MGEKQTVSLVLGSGAARGLAHIGVIEWLNDHGYRIESIAGASMGALVGGIYAAGRLDAYKNWVCALEKADVLRFLDLSFSSEGLFKGERLMEILKDMVGDRDIEDLPVSYTAVATDLERHREVWFTRGSLFEAIRASIAVPTIFTHHRYKGLTLLDGGLLNPVPIAPTFKDITDLTVAVDLNAPRGQEEVGVVSGTATESKPAKESSYHQKVIQFLDNIQRSIAQPAKSDLGMFDLLSNAFETMQNAISSMKLAAYAPDVVVEIPRSSCKAYEFYRAKYMIAIGRQMAEEAMNKRSGQ
jgi:NTE family protein